MLHKPVLLEESVRGLGLKLGAVVVDGTLGSGGHSTEILKWIGEPGRLIGIDQDSEAIERCRAIFKDDPRVTLYRENFENLDKVLQILNIREVDAVILDVGFSSDQLEDPKRGFSFERSGPLDMRMNPDAELTAREIVNAWPEHDLEKIFFEYGGEPRAKAFTRAIAFQRRRQPIETTDDLVRTLQETLPRGFNWEKGRRPSFARRHFATRVFQALRIAVNNELKILENSLPKIWKCIKLGGRFAVISFHSSEDRIVKYQFQNWYRDGVGKKITKKPLIASQEERIRNPRSRSAKLRILEKIG